jgi:uncharacterized protein YdaU (DUF1376 family)
MGNLWYPHYPGDYTRDTAHLTLMEHGAYRLLLDHYYSTAAPLPSDKQRLYRLCRAFHPEEQAAICAVLHDFFTLGADGYHNARADRQLIEMAAKRVKLSEQGRRGAKKRWNGPGNGPANSPAIGREIAKPQPPPQPHPEPDPNPQSQKRENSVGEADVSQKTCDASPESGDMCPQPFEMVDRLGPRELKGLRTTLIRSLRDTRLPEFYRAQVRERLHHVEKRLAVN